MPNYAPSTDPGYLRRRTRFIGIRVPLDTRTDQQKLDGVLPPVPLVEVLEEEVVRLAEAERVIDELGNLPVGSFDPSEAFDLRDPGTDVTIGGTGTVGQAMMMIYSWVRKKQLDRDMVTP